MWFEITYEVRGVNQFTTEVLADSLDDAFEQAQIFAYEEYQNIAGKIDGCPTFTQFCESETADDVVDVYDNNYTEYEQLQKRFADFIDSKTIAQAYYA